MRLEIHRANGRVTRRLLFVLLVSLHQLALAQVTVSISRGTGFSGSDEFYVRNATNSMVRCLIRWTVVDSAFKAKSGYQDVVENTVSRYGAQGKVDRFSYDCFQHPEVARREKERAERARLEQERQAEAARRRQQIEEEAKRRVEEEKARMVARATDAINRDLSEERAREDAARYEQALRAVQEQDRQRNEAEHAIAAHNAAVQAARQQAALARQREESRAALASSEMATALLAMARHIDRSDSSARIQEADACPPLSAPSDAKDVPLERLREVLAQSMQGGPLLSGIAAVRTLLDRSPSGEYAAAAAQLAIRAERDGLGDLAQELRVYASERSDAARLIALLPRRGTSEATAMFDAAASGQLKPPSAQLNESQRAIRSFFVAATVGLLVNNTGGGAIDGRQFLHETARQSFGSYDNFVAALASSSDSRAASDAIEMRIDCK